MSEQPAACRINVEALDSGFETQARQWAERLGLPLQIDAAEFALQVGEQGLQLQQLGPDAPGPVRVDFVEGGAAHRRLYGGGSGQMIAKAVGVAQGCGLGCWTPPRAWARTASCWRPWGVK